MPKEVPIKLVGFTHDEEAIVLRAILDAVWLERIADSGGRRYGNDLASFFGTSPTRKSRLGKQDEDRKLLKYAIA
jgi:hypothetical protein